MPVSLLVENRPGIARRRLLGPHRRLGTYSRIGKASPPTHPEPMVLPVKADRQRRLSLLRQEVFYLGQALRERSAKNAYRILRVMAGYVRLRAYECPDFTADFAAVRECYPRLLQAIQRGDCLGSRDVLSEMIDRAGLAA